MSDAASRHLAGSDPDWAALIRDIGPCRFEQRPEREPYQALIRAVAHQQLHGRAAARILERLMACGAGAFPTPQELLQMEEERLRSCGFSGAKVAALRDIAHHSLTGLVPSRTEAEGLDDEALIERLTRLRGVGQWTVEMLLIFSLGRPDVLPVDDFGVREGFRLLKGLEVQPKPKALRALGRAWAPYRSTAAWYLWRAADRARGTKVATA